ncbi:hypothetical protein C8Q80DRAFT_1097917 [Daedaleopsis nitida]|nr:hypothetical protein C8Q80DRAFT_1097917 [Daedaleopsis nitida]
MPQFYAMCNQFNWDREHPEREQARYRLQDAMVLQFNNMYGTSVNDLKAWQGLCRALEIDPVPDKLKKCQKLVMGVHVNICDLIQAPTLGKPTIFETEGDLAEYTRGTGKIFPRDNFHAGSLLRFLLRHIFSAPSRDANQRRIVFVKGA